MTTRPTATEWEALVDRLNSEPRDWPEMDYTEEDYDRDLAVHDRYARTHTGAITTPVCRCPYEKKTPWVDVTVAYCQKCDRRLSETARDRFRQQGVIQMPWLGNDR